MFSDGPTLPIQEGAWVLVHSVRARAGFFKNQTGTGVNVVDVRYINPFIGAVRHLFKTMLNTDVVISKPALKEKDDSSSDISAIIGFSGGAAGSVTLCFQKRAALKIAEKFAGAEISADDPDLADALGELANIVAGQAKSSLEGLNISISLPRVIAGANHRVLNSNSAPVLTLPCDSPLGRFSVEVTMAVEKQRATAKKSAAAAVSA